MLGVWAGWSWGQAGVPVAQGFQPWFVRAQSNLLCKEIACVKRVVNVLNRKVKENL